MRVERVQIKIPRIRKTAGKPAKKPRAKKPPKVNPRVTAKEALRILKGFPGGEQVIELLRREGKNL